MYTVPTYELPETWQADIVDWLQHPDPAWKRSAAHIIGYRRIAAGQELMKCLEKSPAETTDNIIWALGRLQEKEARNILYPYLLSGADQIRSAAALALLRLQDNEALAYCTQRASSEDWAGITKQTSC
jgi:HEAT repeat protein